MSPRGREKVHGAADARAPKILARGRGSSKKRKRKKKERCRGMPEILHLRFGRWVSSAKEGKAPITETGEKIGRLSAKKKKSFPQKTAVREGNRGVHLATGEEGRETCRRKEDFCSDQRPGPIDETAHLSGRWRKGGKKEE